MASPLASFKCPLHRSSPVRFFDLDPSKNPLRLPVTHWHVASPTLRQRVRSAAATALNSENGKPDYGKSLPIHILSQLMGHSGTQTTEIWRCASW